MDLIKEISDRNKKELADRVSVFETTVLVMSHSGDVSTAGGFEVVRARTLREFVLAETGRIYAFDEQDVRLVDVIVGAQDVIGFRIVAVNSFPDQNSDQAISSVLASLPQMDFLRLMGDIADQRLIEQSMTELEREQSIAKKQHSQRVDKHGDVKPLIDFDRSFQQDPDDAIAPSGSE
ncbi:P7 [Pseudomonas phage phi2954]|uniref:p7 n=1 Tax=Pseudomonas phage phi2954 TaxID=593131 RepID=C0KIT6_9VIRU|nr:P7 [Pseudomonas phage phi2954]ACM91121.1 P7 [Pseudomonas phage phi2954]